MDEVESVSEATEVDEGPVERVLAVGAVINGHDDAAAATALTEVLSL